LPGKALNKWDRVDALRTETGMAGDDVPPGAFTTSDYAAKYGLAYHTATDQLARLVKAGSLKTGKKRAMLPSGRQGSMRYYWP
jgi:hypothetical protein